jgi:hypothetical protein
VNNHADAERCDADALLSGAHVPPRGGRAPLPVGVSRLLAWLRALPLLQTAFAAAALAALVRGSAAAALVAAGSLQLGRRHGASFVARPVLVA